MVMLLAGSGSAAVQPGSYAHYYMGPAGEDAPVPVSDLWVAAEGRETVDGRSFQWWRMIMRKPNGDVIGVRALSEQVPMTGSEGPGEIARYIFHPGSLPALEYIDESTGRALLPGEYDFKKNFLPWPSVDARMVNGFASAGVHLGHPAFIKPDGEEPPLLTFDSPKQLTIRTDFVIGTSRTFKDDGTGRELPAGNYSFIPWTQADYEAMLEAGFNYFGARLQLREWLLRQPAFIYGMLTYPDDLYRSNIVNAKMYIDEPMVRLGWSGGIPGSPTGPEKVAEALRQRVAAHYPLRDRIVNVGDKLMGTLDLVTPKAPSWETEYWSAWYQLQAGAPGIIHEGRYVERGYGWEPEDLLGEDLEHLTSRDMFNFYYAFMRGAARSFDGHWGTSLYGHSEEELRMPAFIRAYEMGAKNLWFWTSDHEHHMPFPDQLSLARQMTEYARANPRSDKKSLLQKAEIGIALPPGYAFSWWGTWGMHREQLNPMGVSYGDVAAAMAWEGIVASRKGIEFDFLVDHDGIEDLGYRQLAIVQEDGSIRYLPALTEARTPRGLRITASPVVDDPISQHQNVPAEYSITRTGPVTIDGDLSDWQDAQWVEMGDSDWYGDSFDFDATLVVPEEHDAGNNNFFGARHVQITEEHLKHYALEAFLVHETFIVLTEVEPGSPAYEAGLREGDMILHAGDRTVKGPMDLDLLVQWHGKDAGHEFEMRVRRSGRAHFEGKEDLGARFAFKVDDIYLYFAAEVTDDIHIQDHVGEDIWRHDSVQVGFAPIMDRHEMEYGENNHEIGFALKGDETVIWRWRGRRGQPFGVPESVKAAVVRKDGVTVYEAAIPVLELIPFAPEVWPKMGINVVVNDSDETDQRKGRLELSAGAMTRGKHPGDFVVFEVEPSGNPRKVSGSFVWDKRAMLEGGAAEFTLGIASPQTTEAIVRAELASLDSPETSPAVQEITLPVSSTPQGFKLKVSSDSPAGRYRLTLSLRSPSGWLAAEDSLPVFIYPQAAYDTAGM